jgi:hypothetical protein
MSGMAPAQEPGRQQQNADGSSVDQLDFLDLLYAVPVGDLAMRVSGAELGRVSAADWSALAVILATIVFSWIGLHKDRAAMDDKTHRRGPIGKLPFFGMQFPQFLDQIAIIGAYFAMGLFLKLPTGQDPAVRQPAEGWLTGLLLVIFGLYLVWDLFDMCLAWPSLTNKPPGPWFEPAWRGALVTTGFLVIAGILFAVTLGVHPQPVALNVILCVFLYAYRVAQDKLGNCAYGG